MITIKNMVQCLLSPRLYNIYRHGSVDIFYQPKKAEIYADSVITLATMFRKLFYYMSPFIVISMYRRGMEYEEFYRILKTFGGLSCILTIAFPLRAYGRASNPLYVQFIEALNSPQNVMSSYLENLRKYDFDFDAWPATYVIPYNPDNPYWNRERPFVSKENQHLHIYQQCIVKFLAYIAVHTFGLRLIYPGSLGLIHYMLSTPLLQGRANLVEDYNGQRVKIVTADGNSIDTMFVDKRPSTKGKTLVICSEGNSGFYEVGIMVTPLKAGYSVLGWNHPGFACSTGLPYPRQEHAAIDAVMQYAIQVLKFQPNEIVMFGWSIGGYSASWAASNYDTKALVLDATFDDLNVLALKQMPESWGPLVCEVIRSHVDLNVAETLRHYRGPVHLVRRSDDEIICLTAGDISTNRGNDLLVKLIKQRHGHEADQLDENLLVRYVSMPEAGRNDSSIYGLDHTTKKILRLIAKYSSDFKSSHCGPLSPAKFESIMRLLNDANPKDID